MKIVSVVIAALACALAIPADAATTKPKKVTRPAEDTYGLPYLISPSFPGGGCFFPVNDCPGFRTSKKEQWVTMQLKDASGTPTAFSIWQKVDPSDLSAKRVGGPFCGSTGDDPVRITGGVPVGVSVYASGDVVCAGAVGTRGTVTAVFSNVP